MLMHLELIDDVDLVYIIIATRLACQSPEDGLANESKTLQYHSTKMKISKLILWMSEE